jgi:hypothetical protein
MKHDFFIYAFIFLNLIKLAPNFMRTKKNKPIGSNTILVRMTLQKWN